MMIMMMTNRVQAFPLRMRRLLLLQTTHHRHQQHHHQQQELRQLVVVPSMLWYHPTITMMMTTNLQSSSFSSSSSSSSSSLHATGRSSSSHKSARQRRRSRKNNNDNNDITPTPPSSMSTLEWETFDFSESPKWDTRFLEHSSHQDHQPNATTTSTTTSKSSSMTPILHLPSHTTKKKDNNNNNNDHDHDNDIIWKTLIEQETQYDQQLQEQFQRQHQAWEQLDDTLIQQALHVLVPYINKDRWERIQTIFQRRTKQTRFLFENPANPSNVWACLRTLDSFGVQHVDVVIQSGQYQGKAALVQKRGMRTAMGSAKWLTIRNHLSTRQALQELKSKQYYILCTDVNPSSKDIRDVDWDVLSSSSSSGRPIVIVMGNEQYGISQHVKDMADESFYLPMVGFAESFNLSVATAIICAHLSAASSNDNNHDNNNNDNDNNDTIVPSRPSRGPLRRGDLDPHEYQTLLLRGALNSIQHKTAKALLKKHGIQLPNDIIW